MKTKAVIRCPAKINLFLDVICRRPDGYHNIETIFQTISLTDSLAIELTSSDIIISSNHHSIPHDETNLAAKAFQKIADVADYRGGVRIHIEKSIPTGAGLGGGSSNAAATLLAMNRLLQAGISEAHLCELGAELGADVPFLIFGGLAAAWQRGDKIMRLPPLPESHIVVAVPHDLAVSTREAFGMLNVADCRDTLPEELSDCSERLQNNVSAFRSSVPLSNIEGIDSILYNAFEKPVLAHHPAIAVVKDALLAAGARSALMSGSGSAVFAPADSSEHAANIKNATEDSSTCECFTARTTDRGCELEHG
jgi:4-diphosphocytidyl-2-C-methyl-D-erythritol kinase